MFNRQPSTFVFDPNNDIVLKAGTTNPRNYGESKEVPQRFAL
jgi:hypothetical protein